MNEAPQPSLSPDEGRTASASPIAQPSLSPDEGRTASASPIAQRFAAALVDAGDPDTAGPDLLPTRLARACSQVLPVDAAGIGVVSNAFRVPLGASDAHAVAAERLQFTLGEGPCLLANAGRQIVVAVADVIESRWPIFNDELIQRSPYRSVVSLPLQIAPQTPGALDLYFQDPNRAETLDLRDAAAVAEQVAAVLSEHATPTLPQQWPDLPVPDWLHSPQAHRRLRTWIAAGMLMAHFGASPSNALDQLRARAYAREQLLDDVADELIEGTLGADEFAP